MPRGIVLFLIVLAVLGTPVPARGQFIVTDSTSNLEMRIGGWIQPRYEFRQAEGEEHPTSTFRIRRVRLDLAGAAYMPELTFRIQVELATGGQLRDAWIAWKPVPALQLKAGQQSPPFLFQASSRRRQFAEASLISDLPRSRDVGVAVAAHGPGVLFEIGAFEGAGDTAEMAGAGLVASRLHLSLHGTLPREEVDLQRKAERLVAVGAGYFRHERKFPAPDGASLSKLSSGSGIRHTGVLDFQVQHRGLTIHAARAKGWEQQLGMMVPTAESWLASAGLMVNRTSDIAIRRSHGTTNSEINEANEQHTELSITRYVFGHDLKVRLAILVSANRRLNGEKFGGLIESHLQF